MTEHNLQPTCNKLATDTISRQAAIDEWKNDFKGYVNMLDIPKDDYNGIMAYIDELPSVQPEPGTSDLISRQAAYNALVKHEESDGQHNYLMFRSVVSECEEIILDLPSAQPKQQWIPCSERLPDKEGMYIVTDDVGGTVGIICDAFFYCDDGKPTWLLSQNAIAWMPLPEVYRE